MLSILVVGLYSAIVSLCLSVRQVFYEPIGTTAFIIAQVILIGVTIICIVMAEVRQKRERDAIAEFRLMRKELATCVYKGNTGVIYEDGLEYVNVRVCDPNGSMFFQARLPNHDYTKKDVVNYIKFALELSGDYD